MLCIVSKYHLQDRTKNKQTNKKRPVMLYHTTRCRLLFVLLRLSASTVVSCSKTITKTTNLPMESWLIYLFSKSTGSREVTRGHVSGLQNRSLEATPWSAAPPDPFVVRREIHFKLSWLALTHQSTDRPTDQSINQSTDWLINWLILIPMLLFHLISCFWLNNISPTL